MRQWPLTWRLSRDRRTFVTGE